MALKFFKYAIDTEMILYINIHEKINFLSPREGITVGSNDMFCKLLEKIHKHVVPDRTLYEYRM